MDARGGKLLEFLKENNHLDLEVPDIAFSVKKSEKTVEAALQKLQQQGLVTARQNEYGRVYWYALPSAPITRSFKADEIRAAKESDMNFQTEISDEIDLSDLKNRRLLSDKRNLLPTWNEEGTPSRETIKIPVVSKESAKPAEANDPLPPSTEDIRDEYIAKNENLIVKNTDNDDRFEVSPHKFEFSSLLLPLSIIVVLISIGSIARSISLETRMTKMESVISKDIVTPTSLQPLKNKINDLEKQVTSQSNIIDSLKSVVTQLYHQRNNSTLQKLKPTLHRKMSTRKRR